MQIAISNCYKDGFVKSWDKPFHRIWKKLEFIPKNDRDILTVILYFIVKIWTEKKDISKTLTIPEYGWNNFRDSRDKKYTCRTLADEIKLQINEEKAFLPQVFCLLEKKFSEKIEIKWV